MEQTSRLLWQTCLLHPLGDGESLLLEQVLGDLGRGQGAHLLLNDRRELWYLRGELGGEERPGLGQVREALGLRARRNG